jgi:adenine C2-methylase RlmN of 23S rRNA A2503 and tRNA A37
MKKEIINGEYDVIHISSHFMENGELICNNIDKFKEDINNYFSNLKFKRSKLNISFDGTGDILLNIKLFIDVYMMENIIKDKYNYKKIDYSIYTSIPNKNILDLEKFVLNNDIDLKINYNMYSPIECTRHKFYPNNVVSVCECLDYLNHFYKKTSNVIINYDFVNGVNDSKSDLNRVCELLNDYSMPIKFTIKNDEWINYIHDIIPNLEIIV